MLEMLDGEVSPALAFAVLLHDIAKPNCFFRDETGRIRFNGHEHVGAEMTENILRRLKFSNQEIQAAAEMVRHHMAFKDAPKMRVSKLRRFMARETFSEEMELHRVDCQSSHGSMDIHSFLQARRKEFSNEPVIPPRLLKGSDLIGMGWKPGPRFRDVLETAQNRQLEGLLTTKDQAIEWLKSEYPEEKSG
jgi:poly(A) polymerase